VTDTTVPNRSATLSSRPSPSAIKTIGKWIAILVVLVAIGFIIGYTLGWHWQDGLLQQVLADRNKAQADINNLTGANQTQAAQITALTDQLKAAQSRLAEFLQQTRKLKLEANRAEPVSIGAFTVGLGNALGSSSVDLNINGKRQDMAPGSALNLTYNCRVELGSFDVLEATAMVNSTCSPANP
jgi:cell division protein FtsB